MPVFTAAASAISTAMAGVTMSSVASFAARTLLTVGVAKLLANRQDTSGSNAPAGAQDNGARIQLDPSTANKLPVIYGGAFVEGVITDAKISTDNQTMWYVIAFSEHIASNANWNFRSLYWNNNEITLDNVDNTQVNSWTNNAEPPQTNTKVQGKINVYFYAGGSNNPVNTTQTAIQVLQDPAIPVDQRWTSTDTMTNTVFMIVKMKYDRDAGTTQVGNWKVQLTNSYGLPGTVLYNYMVNTVYGCGIPANQIDSASFNALNTYSNEFIDFTSNANIILASQTNPCVIQTNVPHGLSNEAKIVISGVTGMTNLNGNTYYVQTVPGFPNFFALYVDANKTIPVNATGYPAYVSGGTFTGQQPRYRINGPIATGNNCMNNLQLLVDACDSWLQYSEMTGRWKVVINKPYTGLETSLFLVDNSNLVSGIDVNPIDLNQTYNSLEVQYPNFNIRDQYDFPIIELADYYPNLLSPNEAANRLTINLPHSNNSIQSTYIGIRRLLQSREDLVISFALDYSGIQIEAGDVIRVKFAPYGWDDPINFPNGKLFRVSQVQETKDDAGQLGVRVTAFEYNDTVYYDDPLNNYVPADNTGLANPNIICQPGTPVIADVPIDQGTIASFTVTTTVPTCGVVLYMDFNYGTSSNITTHRLYRTLSKGDGTPYAFGETVSVTVNDLPPGSYFWSITARNNSGGSSSAASTIKVWAGQNVTSYAEANKTNANSVGTLVTVPSTAGIRVGDEVEVTGGTGSLPPGTRVAGIPSGTQLLLTALPLISLANAALKFFGGGIKPTNIPPNTVGYNQINNSAVVSASLGYIEFSNDTTGTLFDLTAGTYNVPFYLAGTTVSTTKYYPYYQGTSSTADGYRANSTGPWTPVLASDIQLPSNGSYNWWVMAETPFSDTIDPVTEYYRTIYSFQLVSDADTIVQTNVFLTFSTAPAGQKDFDTRGLRTIELKANQPVLVEAQSTGSGTATLNGGGLVIRNMVAGTTVYCADLELEFLKGKNP